VGLVTAAPSEAAGPLEAAAFPAASSAPRGPRRRARGIRSGRYAFLYLSPALLIFFVFILGPAAFMLFISFFHWNMLDTAQSRFRGLANYKALATSASFWHSVLMSAYFVGLSVVLTTLIAFIIALLLSKAGWLRKLARLCVLSPYFTPVVATSIVWIWMFNPQYGLFNDVLKFLHIPTLGWLQSPTWAMPAIVIYTLWHSLGFTVIIFIAGLSAVSTELREAARVDGAGSLREAWHVILPQLTPIVLFVVVITSIASLQAFTQFYTMTGGGPINATTTTGFLLYEEGFVFYHTGLAAAIAVVLFVVIALFTLAQFYLSKRTARV
jgi:ABC-type sugar transport system permease subunit